MKGLACLAVGMVFVAAVLTPEPTAAQSGTEVTGSGSGSFPNGAQYDGVSLRSVRFGKGVIMPGDGSAAGDFEAILVGTSGTGQPREISVQGMTSSGSLNPDKTATFSGVSTVDMGDGTPPNTNVPFTVRVSSQGDGGGTLILTLGSTTLPVAETTEGGITSKTNGQLTLSKKDQSIEFGMLPEKTYGDGPFDVSAAATSGLGVGFNTQAGSNCSVSGRTVTITGAGSCTLLASQSGDGSYNPASEVARTLSIAKASQSIAFAQSRPRTFGDQPFSVAADATASSKLPVSFQITSTDRCAPTTAGSTDGTSIKVLDVGVGTAGCAVTASQLGNGNYSGAQNVKKYVDLYNTIDILPMVSVKAISWSGTKTEVAVAVLTMKNYDGTTSFTANRIDASTVTLWSAGSTRPPAKPALDNQGVPRAYLMDADGDGDIDLLIYFKKADLFGASDVSTTAHDMILDGKLKNSGTASQDGRPIRGTGKLRLDP